MKHQCFMPYVKCPYRSKGSCIQLHNMHSDSSCYKYYFNVDNTEDIPQNQYIMEEFYKIDSILKKYNVNPYKSGNIIDFDNATHKNEVYRKKYRIHNDDFDYDFNIFISFDYSNGVHFIIFGLDGSNNKIIGNGLTIIDIVKIDRIEKLLKKFLNLKTQEEHRKFALKEFGIKNDGYFI
ncbi:hypothetical protein FDC62_12875 [Clostridium botulinum]|uniref:hypothetical protein n=1 Tax=Clostridium botulinum TaxID=1491 RepID=UPI000993FF6C|nr:hypothetical protein [Clostridium botulinum]NFO99062.1 hypothetical protein [Clostridium botulinum]OOV52384.1 hypothetical protein B1A66_04205 [Clostridium botulinum D/C]OOV55746.1 hypothetical protein B1A67_07830 [Clostridium botulinum D/C]OOV57193.1 hypothetical protein B0673_04910 [Clostridium botulinum D/C]